MSVCCVSGCGNQKGQIGKLKFFTIPFGYRTFQANRRTLWLQAIQKVNGSVEELARDARVCGAHFISGQASMDINSPDFVPSVFTHNKQSPGHKKKGKWICDRSKKRRRKASEEAEEQTTPPRADSPDDLHMPHEKETKTKDDKTEDKTLTSETTSSPNKASPSLRLPAGFPDLSKLTPTLLLKSVFKPAVGFQCELCDQSFSTPSQLVKHQQLHEEPGCLICELCVKIFTKRRDYTEHRCSYLYPFACNMCDRSFSTRRNLKRHKRLHEKPGPLICELCVKIFTKRRDLAEHWCSYLYPFACNMCDRSFRSRRNLKSHKRLHEEQRSFICKLCAKIFTKQRDFTEHQCSYLYTFSCNMCDQSFSTHQNLERHKRLHEEQKSFICELCGKLFTDRTDFTEHQRSHEYSFACNMCDRSFNTSQNLKRHKLLHVRDGRKCQKCGVLFCQRHNHVLYVPQTESERDSYIAEESCRVSDGDRMAENAQWVKPDPDQTANLDDGAQRTMTVTYLPVITAQTPSPAPQTPKPLPRTHKALPPASHTRILTEIPVPVFKKPLSVPRPAPPVPTRTRINYPANFVQPHLPQLPALPPSLQMFSPQFLTSAFLEVKRNYEYILSKPRAVKIENIVKEEPCELPLIPPSQETLVERIKGEQAAYDLQIML